MNKKRQETDLRSVCFTVRMRYECAVVRLSPHLGQLIFSKTYCLYKSIYIEYTISYLTVFTFIKIYSRQTIQFWLYIILYIILNKHIYIYHTIYIHIIIQTLLYILIIHIFFVIYIFKIKYLQYMFIYKYRYFLSQITKIIFNKYYIYIYIKSILCKINMIYTKYIL